MRPDRRLWALLLLAFAAACSEHDSTLDPSVQTPKINEQPPLPEVGQSNQTIHIDPNTGELLPEPPVNVMEAIATTSPATAVEYTVTPLEQGGSYVDLGDSFQSPLVAVIGCDGKLATTHIAEDKIDAIQPDCGDSKEGEGQ